MVAQKKSVVPGMPMHALNAIKDENVRTVLQALASGHDVRNGNTGNGDERFVTAAEIAGIRSNVASIINLGQNGSPSDVLLSPSQIGRIITDLQSQVIESPLFKELGERVDLIDKPGGIFDRVGATEVKLVDEITQRTTADTAEIQAREVLGARVGTTEAAIVTERSVRANADNAIVQSVTTQFASVNQNLGLVQTRITTVANNVAAVSSQVNQVQSSVGQVAVAIQQESETRASIDGEINAKYTVKIDNNGYVSGYGLMSTSNNSVPFSEFIVRADRFAIGSASGPQPVTPKVPFIVTTTDSVAGGVVAPAGVYIQDAFIKNGSISNAKIGNLEVDTLKIRGNAVTVPLARSYTGTTSGAGLTNFISVARGSIVLDFPAMVYVATTGPIAYGNGFVPAQSLLRVNGSTVSASGGDEAYDNALHSVGIFCNAGVVNVELFFAAQDARARIVSPTLFIQGAKK